MCDVLLTDRDIINILLKWCMSITDMPCILNKCYTRLLYGWQYTCNYFNGWGSDYWPGILVRYPDKTLINYLPHKILQNCLPSNYWGQIINFWSEMPPWQQYPFTIFTPPKWLPPTWMISHPERLTAPPWVIILGDYSTLGVWVVTIPLLADCPTLSNYSGWLPHLDVCLTLGDYPPWVTAPPRVIIPGDYPTWVVAPPLQMCLLGTDIALVKLRTENV